MKQSALIPAFVAVLATCGWASSAVADSNEATCQVRKDGETKQGQSGPCTFSQRQGYIDLDLRNGDTISLSPGSQPNHFKDQKGNKVIRTQAGGNTQEFKWESGKKVVVTFGSSPSSGGGGGAAGAIAVSDMARYCAGEASAKFGVKPRDITTQNARQTQGMWEVWGQYGANAQVFICSFNAEKQFLSVDLYKP
ncbi:MAG: YsaB family lipoprotein [Steroidobacteraceae bacterium]